MTGLLGTDAFIPKSPNLPHAQPTIQLVVPQMRIPSPNPMLEIMGMAVTLPIDQQMPPTIASG